MAKVIQHQARKRFGQNFLIDEGVIRRIVRSISPKSDDNLVEIGPGQGAITASLLDACSTLNVIELDRDLIPMLKVRFDKYREFTVHEADALKFEFSKLLKNDKALRVVGNLPYNISTPLIFRLLEQRNLIDDMHFMLQKEVVLRLAAKPGDKNYGRLSVMAQYFCEVEDLFDVPPECFRPAPKVMSAIVRMTPYKTLPWLAKDPKYLEHVVKLAFQQRRKTLRNALKPVLDELEALGASRDSLSADLSLRAERLSVADFVKLSNELYDIHTAKKTETQRQ